MRPNEQKSCKNNYFFLQKQQNLLDLIFKLNYYLFFEYTILKVIYKETLPYDLAPSFRGQFARYTYKLTIGAQKLNRNTQLLRLPFKVYSLLGKR